ncbi:MAG: DUF368 domain-containing protein [Acutalibacteraceae bacterium]|nr:DUF368 domain-containing protein [Acutalibacteraceae bacterium]
MKGFLYRILCGFCLGISIFAPGISGSIMAIIMGIYDKLIEITSNPFKNFKNNLKFLFPMGIGAVISLVLFVLVFSYLFETYESVVYMLFVGLIAGNLPMIYKEANKNKFKWYYLIGAVVAVAIAFAVGVMSKGVSSAQTAGDSVNLAYIALSGAITGMASIVPGMSISMILIVMGVYDTLIAAAKSLDIAVIGVVGIAFVVAMVLFSRVIKFVFNRFNGVANYMVLGFLVGSIGGVVCTLPAGSFSLPGIIMLVIGLLVSLLFVFLGKKVNIEDYE